MFIVTTRGGGWKSGCRHALSDSTFSTIRRQTAVETASIDNNSRTSRTTASRHVIGLHTLIVGRDGYELQSLTP
jgi:hypothetical protein